MDQINLRLKIEMSLMFQDFNVFKLQ